MHTIFGTSKKPSYLPLSMEPTLKCFSPLSSLFQPGNDTIHPLNLFLSYESQTFKQHPAGYKEPLLNTRAIRPWLPAVHIQQQLWHTVHVLLEPRQGFLIPQRSISSSSGLFSYRFLSNALEVHWKPFNLLLLTAHLQMEKIFLPSCGGSLSAQVSLMFNSLISASCK